MSTESVDDALTDGAVDGLTNAAPSRSRFGLGAMRALFSAFERDLTEPGPELASYPILGVAEHGGEAGDGASPRPAPRPLIHVPLMLHRPFALALVFAVLLGVGGRGVAAQPAELDPRLAGFPELTIRLTDETVETPDVVAAGPTLLVEENQGSHSAHVFVLRIPDDVSDEQAALDLAPERETIADDTPEWLWRGEIVGNPDRARADGGRVFGLVDLQPGRYLVLDPLDPSRFDRFRAIAWTGFLPIGREAPAADVVAELTEMDFVMPATVPAGRTLWQVTNVGAMLHEIAIFPVPADATIDQVVALTQEGEGAAWPEWSRRLVGGVGAMTTGGSVLAQFDLEPGTYAAVCFVPMPDGTPHFMVGMTRLFTVAPEA